MGLDRGVSAIQGSGLEGLSAIHGSGLERLSAVHGSGLEGLHSYQSASVYTVRTTVYTDAHIYYVYSNKYM